MALTDELEAQGRWLFRWRGYLPMAVVALLLAALRDYQWPFGSHAHHEIWARACLGVSILGLAVRCLTVGFVPAGTSGRNSKRQVAACLNTTGTYSLVRHPLYFGNFFIGLGVVMVPVVLWLPAIYCLLFAMYYERIMYAEERFLHNTFGKEFDDWAAQTPAIVPRHIAWQRPPLPFSFRNVLRREYTGLMVVVLGNAGMEFTEHLIMDQGVVYERFWVTFIITGTAIYFILRSLKKYTTLLNVSGR
jgi:protein-S-isoprenylcysteine O-methyltransferase Ste14